jgi:hypothetical protein
MFQIVPLKLVKILIINMIVFFGVPRTKVEHPRKNPAKYPGEGLLYGALRFAYMAVFITI